MKLVTADIANNPPATQNGMEYEFVASYKAPASGDPTIAAAPRNKINKPNAFVNLSKPNKSTNMIDVSEIQPARKLKKKKY